MLEAYRAARAQIRTGDILLFSGGGLISRLIKIGTGSDWSHVGLACWIADGLLMCWESTTLSTVPDFETGKPHKGVQLVDLSTRIAQYDGRVAWRPLRVPALRALADNGPAMAQGEPARRAGLLEVRERFRGAPYEESNFELIRSAVDTLDRWTQQPDASSLFCSEAAGYAHQALGWLDRAISPNELTPADFAGDGIEMPWRAGVTVGAPVEIGVGAKPSRSGAA